MGSVDAVGGQAAQMFAAQGTQGTQGTHGHHHRHGGGGLDSAAKALGMDVKDVADALKSGKSLDDLAKEKGVSHDDLVSAVKAGLPQGVQQSGRADQIAESIVTRKGAPPAPQAGAPTGAVSGVMGSSLNPTQQATLDGLSSLLGTTSDDLLSSLRGGTSLAQMVDDRGVDRDQLASVVQDGLLVDTSA